MRNPIDAATFWQASLEIYQRPGMQQQLIARQDQHGDNVNVALLELYLAEQGQPLDTNEKQVLQALIDAFSTEHTQLVRQLRRQLSRSEALTEVAGKALKQALLDAELILEQQEQALLITHLQRLRA
ncbi:MAG: TIGR02444 family protein [Firmicutes bacterium]|nr:TIGR02444 family protein [Bacillota bacterium]